MLKDVSLYFPEALQCKNVTIYISMEDSKMRYAKIRYALLVSVLVLFIVSLALPASVCDAQRRVKLESVLPKHYPDGFDGVGYINRIGEDEIVIDDSFHKLSPFVRYATPTRRNALRSQFRAGDFVGYIKNSKHEIESLWVLKQ
jgi:hypothetical protein